VRVSLRRIAAAVYDVQQLRQWHADRGTCASWPQLEQVTCDASFIESHQLHILATTTQITTSPRPSRRRGRSTAR
jgi:hypothetical protein